MKGEEGAGNEGRVFGGAGIDAERLQIPVIEAGIISELILISAKGPGDEGGAVGSIALGIDDEDGRRWCGAAVQAGEVNESGIARCRDGAQGEEIGGAGVERRIEVKRAA